MDDDGKTPLDWAVASGEQEIADHLKKIQDARMEGIKIDEKGERKYRGNMKPDRSLYETRRYEKDRKLPESVTAHALSL